MLYTKLYKIKSVVRRDGLRCRFCSELNGKHILDERNLDRVLDSFLFVSNAPFIVLQVMFVHHIELKLVAAFEIQRGLPFWL